MATTVSDRPFTRSANRILGSSQMADRTREFPWESTALGSIEIWSDSLVSTVNLTLASPISTILMVGPELVVLYNDAYIPTLVERHPRALGQKGDVLWADAWSAVGHEIEAVRDTGATFMFENMLIPILRDGKLSDAYFTYSFSPMFDAVGNRVSGVMCMARDVTAGYRAMQNLAESERKLSSAVKELGQVTSATTDAIVSIDREWRFSYLNPQAIETYARGRDLLGKKLWEEFPDAVYEDSPFVTNYERAMYEKKAGHFEAYYPAPLDIWIRLSVFPTDDGIVTFSRDITQEKRSAAVLLQTEKLAAVGRLASSISHEINNPLEAVTNLLFLVKTDAALSQTSRDYLATADRELARVSQITSQTLRFHRQSTAATNVRPEDLVEEVVAIYGTRLKNAGITIDREYCDDTRVTCYEGDIRQVLNNLIGNAVSAMKAGGHMQLRTCYRTWWSTAERGVAITICDDGAGMDESTRARAFEAFFTTKGIHGTGLGLWISQRIVHKHRGHIRVRSSQAEGRRGTVFTVWLPLQLADSAREAWYADDVSSRG